MKQISTDGPGQKQIENDYQEITPQNSTPLGKRGRTNL